MKAVTFKIALKALAIALFAYAGFSDAAPLPPKMKNIIPMGGGALFARGLNHWDNEIYEASSADKKLYIINGATDRVKDAIILDFGPQGVAYYRADDRILMVNMGTDSLHIVDRKTKNLVGSPIPIPGHHAVKVDVDQALGKAWVTSMHGGSVSVVDIKSQTVLDTISIGTGGPLPPHCDPFAGECASPGATPIQVVVDQKRHLVYVASYTENHVTVINGRNHKVIGSRIPVGSVPNGMGLNEATNRIYVANWQDGTVSVIDGATRQVTATIPVGSGAQQPQHCYEAQKIDGCVKWGSMPIGPIGVNAADNRMYVANSNDGTISVINGKTNKVLGKPVPVTTGKLMPDGCFDFGLCKSGSAPRGVLFNQSTKKLYVESAHDKWISVLDATPLVDCVLKPGKTDECF